MDVRTPVGIAGGPLLVLPRVVDGLPRVEPFAVAPMGAITAFGQGIAGYIRFARDALSAVAWRLSGARMDLVADLAYRAVLYGPALPPVLHQLIGGAWAIGAGGVPTAMAPMIGLPPDAHSRQPHIVIAQPDPAQVLTDAMADRAAVIRGLDAEFADWEHVDGKHYIVHRGLNEASEELTARTLFGPFVTNIERRLADRAPDAGPLRILTIGPGVGHLEGELKREFGDAIDITTFSLTDHLDPYNRWAVSTVVLGNMDIDCLPRGFDIIFSSHGVYHAVDQQHIFLEIAASLNCGGEACYDRCSNEEQPLPIGWFQQEVLARHGLVYREKHEMGVDDQGWSSMQTVYCKKERPIDLPTVLPEALAIDPYQGFGYRVTRDGPLSWSLDETSRFPEDLLQRICVRADAEGVVLNPRLLAWGIKCGPFGAIDNDCDNWVKAGFSLDEAVALEWSRIVQVFRPPTGSPGSSPVTVEGLQGGVLAEPIDTALLETVARREGKPLAALLNPHSALDVIETAAAIPLVDAAQARKIADAHRAAGFTHITVEVGDDPRKAAARVQAVVDAYRGAAQAVAIALDARGRYKAGEAVGLLRRLRKRGIRPVIFLDPVTRHHWKGLRHVRDEAVKQSTRVFFDPSGLAPEEMEPLSLRNVADGVAFDLDLLGGLIPTIRMMEACLSSGFWCMVTGRGPSAQVAGHLALASGVMCWADLGMATPRFNR